MLCLRVELIRAYVYLRENFHKQGEVMLYLRKDYSPLCLGAFSQYARTDRHYSHNIFTKCHCACAHYDMYLRTQVSVDEISHSLRRTHVFANYFFGCTFHFKQNIMGHNI